MICLIGKTFFDLLGISKRKMPVHLPEMAHYAVLFLLSFTMNEKYLEFLG